MDRTPIILERPSCFAIFKDDSECSGCTKENDCNSIASDLSQLRTIEEIAASLVEVSQTINIEEGLMFFIEEYTRVGGKLNHYLRRAILTGPRWRTTMERIISACTIAEVDPRLYIRAQVETMGRWAVKNDRPFYNNMLEGDKARERFKEWLERNRRKYADHHRLTLDGENDLIVPETHFVEMYFESSDKAKAVARDVRKRHGEWSLQKGREDASLRVRALRDYLASLNTALPRQLCLRSPVFKWGTVRREVLKLLGG